MGSNILKSVLTILIVGVLGLFGFTVTPEGGAGLAIFTALAGLSVKVQTGIAVALLVLVLVPFIAPYTPWTWDDKSIKYKDGVTKIFGQLWNLLAHNFGRASNDSKSG